LVTHQTGTEGKLVRKVLIAEATDIEKEYYLGLVLDRGRGCPVFMVSAEGGVEIEKVAAETPEKLLKVWVDLALGIQPYQGRRIAAFLGLTGTAAKTCRTLVKQLFQVFTENDCSLVEINPLITTPKGELIALDAKINLEDNALFRHPKLAALRDKQEEDPLEVEASEFDLNYIRLDGTIGCMVNGAGLAMATMDIIKHCGGEPANFLDVGGGANRERVTAAFKLLLEDPHVKAILVNIFGGIVRCDVIADGIVAAVKDVTLDRPLVVRLEGTNVERGKEILAQSGLPIQVAQDLGQAAQLAVAAGGQS